MLAAPARSTISGLLMHGMLRLRGIQLDLNGLVVLVYFELLAESLVALGDDLNENRTLGHLGNLGETLLIGAGFPGGDNLLTQLHHRAALHKPNHDRGAVNGLTIQIFDHNLDPRLLAARE